MPVVRYFGDPNRIRRLARGGGFGRRFYSDFVGEAVFLSNRIIVMAAHPGRWHTEISVDLPYPRRPELRAQAAFQAKVNEVSHRLHEVEVHG